MPSWIIFIVVTTLNSEREVTKIHIAYPNRQQFAAADAILVAEMKDQIVTLTHRLCERVLRVIRLKNFFDVSLLVLSECGAARGCMSRGRLRPNPRYHVVPVTFLFGRESNPLFVCQRNG